jgi:hypothetical protein
MNTNIFIIEAKTKEWFPKVFFQMQIEKGRYYYHKPIISHLILKKALKMVMMY